MYLRPHRLLPFFSRAKKRGGFLIAFALAVSLLSQTSAAPPPPSPFPLHRAAQQRDLTSLRALLRDTPAAINNGDPDGVDDLIDNQGLLPGFNSTARAGAIPIAGDFDHNPVNGDEIGLYYSGIWALDTNHDYVLDKVITSNLQGAPIVGDNRHLVGVNLVAVMVDRRDQLDISCICRWVEHILTSEP